MNLPSGLRTPIIPPNVPLWPFKAPFPLNVLTGECTPFTSDRGVCHCELDGEAMLLGLFASMSMSSLRYPCGEAETWFVHITGFHDKASRRTLRIRIGRRKSTVRNGAVGGGWFLGRTLRIHLLECHGFLEADRHVGNAIQAPLKMAISHVPLSFIASVLPKRGSTLFLSKPYQVIFHRIHHREVLRRLETVLRHPNARRT